MTIFKTFFKLVNKNKVHLILYTALLISFTCITLSNNETNLNYADSKPDVIIIDNDNSKLSNHFKNYFKKSAKVKDKDFTNDQIEDELFYRFSSYVIYIPKGFEQSIFDGNIKQIEYKSVDDYEASLASLTLNKYLSVLDIYKDIDNDIDSLINHIDTSLEGKTTVTVNSKLNSNSLSRVGFYYSFMNYSLLAGCIYVLVVIISIFRKQNILQRNIISGMNYNKLNRELLLSGFLFAFFVWLIYVGISFIIGGKTVLTTNGICMIILSFIFLIYAISIGFLISNLLKSKNAINGIINVISLGSSFLCGVFVSLEFLPSSVLKLAHFIPNYYYIDGITKLSKMENISIDTLKPLFSNVVILLVSSLVFILLSFVISKKRRKLA